MRNNAIRRRTTRTILISVIVVITALSSHSGKGASTELSHDRHSKPGCNFGPPQSLGPTINSVLFEGGPTVSEDERTLIFTATRDSISQQEDLFISERMSPDNSWGTPKLLPPTVNDPRASEFSPRLSHDSKTLYFASNRSKGFGAADIYISRRKSPNLPWSSAQNLGSLINTAMFEAFATPSADGNTLYFERSTAAASPDADIWVTTRKNQNTAWSIPQRLPSPMTRRK